jgi:3-phenylpropionate/cinnamic acid dioxygenase small subunit
MSATQNSLQVTATDRLVIAELLARYADALDRGDFPAVGELFEHAVIDDTDGGRVAAGRDEVVALYGSMIRLHDDRTPRTAHVITNVIIDPLGPGEVEMRSRFTVFQATPTLPLQPIVVGRYHDRVSLIDGQWRFVHRVMDPEGWGNVSDHLRTTPSG